MKRMLHRTHDAPIGQQPGVAREQQMPGIPLKPCRQLPPLQHWEQPAERSSRPCSPVMGSGACDKSSSTWAALTARSRALKRSMCIVPQSGTPRVGRGGWSAWKKRFLFPVCRCVVPCRLSVLLCCCLSLGTLECWGGRQGGRGLSDVYAHSGCVAARWLCVL